MKKIFLILLVICVFTLISSTNKENIVPDVKLIHGKLGPNMQNWTYNIKKGIERYSGRVIYWAKIIKKNGFIPLEKWKWKIDYNAFIPGTLLDHNETWGEFNKKRKLGGWIKKTELKMFYMKVTAKRRFIKKGKIKEFSWFRIIKNVDPISGIGEETRTHFVDTNIPEDPEPINPINCKKEFNNGYKKGLMVGAIESKRKYSEGFENGKKETLKQYENIKKEAYENGLKEGKKIGYEQGYNKGKKYFIDYILGNIFKN